MINISRVLLIVCTALTLAACDIGPKSSVGFTLPDGNVDQGRSNYITFRCNTCHSNDQVEQLEGSSADISVSLGGETTRIRTYGELVTSIINPSHRIAHRSSSQMADESGASRMVNFNDTMTVTQMIDLVAFVQSLYQLAPHKTTPYPVYWMPDTDGEGAGE